MPAAQPANTQISVFRRVRAFRQNLRHTSIKHLTTPWEGFRVAVPGEEVDTVEHRDPTGVNAVGRTDAFRFGHAVTVAPRYAPTLAQVLAGVPGIKLVALPANPREVQIENTPSHRTDELFQEIAAVGPGTAFTY